MKPGIIKVLKIYLPYDFAVIVRLQNEIDTSISGYKMELNELLHSIKRLEGLNTRKEFVKYFKNYIDDFSDIFICDYLEKMNSIYHQSVIESTNDLYMKIYDRLKKKSRILFDEEDLSFFKITIFFECLLNNFITDKQKFLDGNNLKKFDEITALLKTIYSLFTGEIDLYIFRTDILTSFNSYNSRYPFLIKETKDKIKKDFFILLNEEFISLFFNT